MQCSYYSQCNHIYTGVEIKHSICGNCFACIYDLTRYDLKYISQEIKRKSASFDNQVFNNVQNQLVKSHKTPKLKSVSLQEASTFTKSLAAAGFDINKRDVAQLCAADNIRLGLCVAWLTDLFEFGDETPTANRIEIDHKHLTALFRDYENSRFNKEMFTSQPVSYATFTHLYRERFHYVSARKQLSVQGTCHDCAMLRTLKENFTDLMNRTLIQTLSKHHALMVKTEKEYYYFKIARAFQSPERVLSGTYCLVPFSSSF